MSGNSTQKLQVAVLDDYHGLSKAALADLADWIDCTVFNDTLASTPDPQPLISRLQPFDILLTMRERTRLTREVILGIAAKGGKGGRVKVILTTGMRNLGIDYEACKEMGIVLTGTPGHALPAGTPPSFIPTIQHTWSLILALASNVPRDNALLPAGQWLNANPLNTFLAGKTLGLLGLGRLGKGVGRIASLAFGMRVVAWSENLTQDKADAAALEVGLEKGAFEAVSKEEVFRQTDVLSVLLLLSDRTTGIVAKADLEQMKPTAFLVNTARGPIVNESDLLDHLEAGKIRGAAVDVFDEEPLPLGSRWRTTKWGREGRSEVILTPHAGYAYEGSSGMGAMWEGLRAELGRVIGGEEVKYKLA